MSLQPQYLAPPPAPPVHEPVPDDREPKTRRKMMMWDRLKVLVLLSLIFAFWVAIKHSDVPIMSWGEAIRDQLRAKWWLPALFGIEVLRQIHYLISERSVAYNQFWQEHIWGAWNRRASKLNPWLRFRINRIFRWFVWGTILIFIFAAIWGVSPVEAIAQAPARLWNNPFGSGGFPWFFQIFFVMFIAIIQFVAIFWFMSRGGVDTYMPEEIKTRYADVWGQDHVLEKVKENISLLERPAEIEQRGGHVPSGILLWGPPGTGKTLMAEAVAGETGKPYVFVDPGAFVNMFMGVGILKVKSLFRKLRKLSLKYGGVIVFFDEADSLGNRGGQVTEGIRERTYVYEPECNCSAYLSNEARQVLEQRYLETLPSTAEPERRSIRDSVIMGGMGMGGGGAGTLQALLAELSGLQKPRGFLSRRLRQYLNMKPKAPPKYRILIMMATNMPDSLDQALLRPGRIDRKYKVGYPSLSGRKRTYQGYLDKVRNTVTDENLGRISLMTPYATGASIKDMVNEGLLVAMRDGRDAVTWQDLLRAKQNLTLGPSEGFEYVERERHAVAIHEACHAVAAYKTRQHYMIDLATIERRGDTGGFVSSVPPEDRFTHWRTEYESDILVSLASLAGERMFFDGDNSSGVGGDMFSATQLLMTMHAYWGMGTTVASHSATKAKRDGITSRPEDGVDRNVLETEFGRRLEARLQELRDQAAKLLSDNRRWVFAVAHALETHQTITGDDIDAIFRGTDGPNLHGAYYHTDDFVVSYEAYHLAATEAHREHAAVLEPLPVRPPISVGNGHATAAFGPSPWAPPLAPGTAASGPSPRPPRR